MKRTVNILRIILGIVFIFSGFVKAVDPVGTQIKFEDYFMAMGLDFMMPSALFFSFLLNTAELGLGILLVINVFPKFSAWGALAFMAIFTPLTLWLAIDNPVSDCGCFGDAVKLTNWQTFWKNAVLVLIALIVLIFGTLRNNYSKILSWSIFVVAAILILGFQIYNFRHLPVIDFRPFYEGSNIKEKITVPDDAPHDEYDTKLFYVNNKTGERKEFTIDNAPYDDTLVWAFDTTENVLVKEGYKPPIHDFVLTDTDGEDRTSQILENPSHSLIFISFDFSEADKDALTKIERISKFAEDQNFAFYIFTASGMNTIEKFLQQYKFKGTLCTGDKTMLKTIVRSNPALVLMKNANIVKKWHYNDIPENNEFKEFIK